MATPWLSADAWWEHYKAGTLPPFAGELLVKGDDEVHRLRRTESSLTWVDELTSDPVKKEEEIKQS